MVNVTRVVFGASYGLLDLGELIDRADVLDFGGATLEQFKL